MYAQAGAVSYSQLSDQEREWLESQDPFAFVTITEGDESELRKIDTNSPRSLQEMEEGERVLVCNQDIDKYPELDGKQKSPSFWNGESVFTI